MYSGTVILFAKYPAPGKAKTRLIPTLGASGAARLAESFLLDLTERLAGTLDPEIDCVLCIDPPDAAPAFQTLLAVNIESPGRFEIVPQNGDDLGSRLSNALKTIRQSHPAPYIFIGADAPDLPAWLINRAAAAARDATAFMVRATDGGYVLLALPATAPWQAFLNIQWSTQFTALQQYEQLLRCGISTIVDEHPWRDVDDPDDLPFLASSLNCKPTLAPRSLAALSALGIADAPLPNARAPEPVLDLSQISTINVASILRENTRRNMSAQIIEGTALANSIRAEIAIEAAELRAQGKHVCLACVQVGAKPESQLYVNSQKKLCASMGIDFQMVQLPDTISQIGLMHKIHELNARPEITAIILELPLPSRLNTFIAQRAIDPNKDAEGVHPVNLGLLVYGVGHHAPCTANAAFQLIKSTGVDLRGLECTIVGHSQIVGRPIGLLLLHDFCTVTTCHVQTRDLAFHTRRADVLVVAVGKAGLIKADMVKEGAMVIDVGVNRVPILGEDGKQALNKKGEPAFKTVGDVDYEPVREKAGWITPVPGGVGPMTVTMLLRNVVNAAKKSHGLNL